MVERDGRRLYSLLQQHSQHLSTVWPPHSGKVPLSSHFDSITFCWMAENDTISQSRHAAAGSSSHPSVRHERVASSAHTAHDTGGRQWIDAARNPSSHGD